MKKYIGLAAVVTFVVGLGFYETSDTGYFTNPVAEFMSHIAMVGVVCYYVSSLFEDFFDGFNG